MSSFSRRITSLHNSPPCAFDGPRRGFCRSTVVQLRRGFCDGRWKMWRIWSEISHGFTTFYDGVFHVPPIDSRAKSPNVSRNDFHNLSHASGLRGGRGRSWLPWTAWLVSPYPTWNRQRKYLHPAGTAPWHLCFKLGDPAEIKRSSHIPVKWKY